MTSDFFVKKYSHVTHCDINYMICMFIPDLLLCSFLLLSPYDPFFITNICLSSEDYISNKRKITYLTNKILSIH